MIFKKKKRITVLAEFDCKTKDSEDVVRSKLEKLLDRFDDSYPTVFADLPEKVRHGGGFGFLKTSDGFSLHIFFVAQDLESAQLLIEEFISMANIYDYRLELRPKE